MDTKYDFGGVRMDVSLGRELAGRPAKNDPFRIAVLGDFHGSSAGKAKPVPVDRDNFDDIFGRFGVSIELPVAGRISFNELDDFHPDHLYERVPLFEPLREALAATAAPKAKVTPRSSSPAPSSASLGNLLEEAMNATESRSERIPASDPLRAWVSEQAAPYITVPLSAESAQQRELITSVIGAQMRAVIHYPDFQQLESLWRATQFLVRRTDTDHNLKIVLIDVRRDEVQEDAAAIHKLLEAHGPWSLLVGAYSFGSSEHELRTLSALGAIASKFGGSFVSEARPQLIGCEDADAMSDPAEWLSPQPGWEEFRSSAAASHVGLVMPRFLLRQPYGAKTDPCERIAFEEMGPEHHRERLLWGNPAILCASLLGASFEQDGWSMRPGRYSNMDRLPVYIYQEDGETVVQACAETLMTERAAQAMLNRGVMCLASLKDTDEVKLVRFQSVSRPPGPLAGPWQ